MLQSFRKRISCCLLLWLGCAPAPVLFAAPQITEFMADNETRLRDIDGEYSDWIEIHNPDAAPVSLAGYHLTDNPANLDKWTFPDVTIQPGGYLLVFASGKDRVDPATQLHTDFSLTSTGEFLALVAPDAQTIISSFAPMYPEQGENESFGIAQIGGSPTIALFTSPTPGAANGVGTRIGPIFTDAVRNPVQPTGGPLTITAAVSRSNDDITGVRMYYRKMYATETVVNMTDDGTEGDAVAADGIWTAVIPSSAFAAGEMTRWRFVATDAKGTETKEPQYRRTTDSPQYYGTVTADSDTHTLLPVLHWFTQNVGGAGTATGSRGSVYYDGEFYDNVLFNVHGQSTSGFPKKSYNIDFNRNHRFRWNNDAPRVADIDLLTNWADKSKVRHILAYEIMRASGVAAHFAFTVRVEHNGSFYSIADVVEDADEIYLERAGLNPAGALYKAYANQLNKDAGNNANSGFEKKTRKTENNADLQALIDGLDLTGTALANYLFDNIDIPRTVNMLAVNSVIRNIDMHSKNWYIYRDTGVTDEWAILPWDLDLSQGRVWNQQNTYFDNAIYHDGYVVTADSIRLVSHLFANPATRAMIMRRIRTLTDRFLQPPPAAGTPENSLFYERRLNEQLALLDPPSIVPSDARQDFEKWGSWIQGGSRVAYTSTHAHVETMAEAIQRFKTEYLPRRRDFIYNTQVVGRGGQIPLPQTTSLSYDYTPLVTAGAPAKVIVPVDNTLGIRWIGISTYEPFDTSTWLSGTTGVGYERGTGYAALIGLNLENAMYNKNGSAYIRVEFNVDNLPAFDRLELRVKYDDGFVAFLNGTVLASANAPASPQWNSTASSSREADPATFDIIDVTSKRGSLRQGRNILAIQIMNDDIASSDLVMVPELYGAVQALSAERQPIIDFGQIEPSPASGNQDQEFVELQNRNNIAVDVSGWRITGGIEHTLAPGTVLPANGSLYLTPNAKAFRSRTVSPKGGEARFVQSGYQGHLSNLGETLLLLDPAGNTNNTATFEGEPTPAQRFLVITEVMYHPQGNAMAEYIELMNIGPEALNLTGIRFTQGVEFDFTGSAINSLAPGARVLIVRDQATFNAIYGAGKPVAGVFANDTGLNNSGETVKLEDPDNNTIRQFTYSDSAPWPTSADGAGYSLVLISPETNPDPALVASWRASAAIGGTPGAGESGGFNGDPLADTNQNGEPDLLDYALGNNLGLPQIKPAVTVGSAGNGALQFSHPINPNAQGAQIEIHYSTDLVTWQNAADHLENKVVTPTGDGRSMVRWNLKPALQEDPRVFMRLRVTAQ